VKLACVGVVRCILALPVAEHFLLVDARCVLAPSVEDKWVSCAKKEFGVLQSYFSVSRYIAFVGVALSDRCILVWRLDMGRAVNLPLANW
jgi:hypothetical protein